MTEVNFHTSVHTPYKYKYKYTGDTLQCTLYIYMCDKKRWSSNLGNTRIVVSEMLIIKTEIWANNKKERKKKTVSERKKISESKMNGKATSTMTITLGSFKPEYGIEQCCRCTHCAAWNENKWWEKNRRRRKKNCSYAWMSNRMKSNFLLQSKWIKI